MKHFIPICLCVAATTAFAGNVDRDWAQLDKDFEQLNQRFSAQRAKPAAPTTDKSSTVAPQSVSAGDTPQEFVDQSQPEGESGKPEMQDKEAL